MGRPGLRGGERGTPDGQDLRALVDPLEAFFRFGDGFNRRNPELLGARSVERYANALPAIFHAKRGAWNAAAEAQILRAGRSLEETIRLGRREEIQHGLNSNREVAIERRRQADFHFTRDFAAARRGTKRKQFRDGKARAGILLPMPRKRTLAKQLSFALRGTVNAKCAASKPRIFLKLNIFVISVTAQRIEQEQAQCV